MSQCQTFALKPGQLHEMIRLITEKTTLDVAQIDLRLCSEEPNPQGDVCTVYTSFAGGYQTRFVLCADREFLHQLTDNMMGEHTDDPEDLEEYAKEYVNVLCGRLVGAIFHETRMGASFHPPMFVNGHYTAVLPREAEEHVICFVDPQEDAVLVAHNELITA